MKEIIDDIACEICGHQLVLNYSDRGPMSGICDECGAMYTYDLEDGSVIDVNYFVDFDVEETIISEYYKETGNTAFLISHIECSQEDVNAFLEWANKNYPDLGWAES